MIPVLLSWFAVAFAISVILTKLIAKFAVSFNVVDRPNKDRKVHHQPIPLLGGVAIFLAVVIPVLILLFSSNILTGGEITTQHYLGFLLGGLVLIIGGVIDDKYDLSPKFAFTAPAIAALVTIIFGIEVSKLTNPLGGVFVLTFWQSGILVWFWLIGTMYTTKVLDGLDGLSGGIAGVGSLIIMLLALTTAYYQPDVALLAIIIVGAIAGFLLWNIHPARIFLGEGGSTLVGFLIGVLAVISGGKLAIALLVLGVPILDLAWVILRRYQEGGLKNIFKGDRRHLHHRLLDLGWSQQRILGTYLLLAISFGLAGLYLQSIQKVFAIIILAIVMVFFAFFAILYKPATITK